MVIDNMEYEITNKYNIKNYKYNSLSIKLINKISDIRYMFDGCSSLLSLPNISSWDTNNVIDISGMFNGCSFL